MAKIRMPVANVTGIAVVRMPSRSAMRPDTSLYSSGSQLRQSREQQDGAHRAMVAVALRMETWKGGPVEYCAEQERP